MKKAINIVLLISMLAANVFAGVPSVTQMEVTDVTPASFAVTWVASEASVASLSVYQADCATPASGLTTTVQKNDATGVMRATASGLAASTYVLLSDADHLGQYVLDACSRLRRPCP